MASHPMVPIEVFETVIDQSSDNTTSLRGLSLTCRAFLPRARYHLFSSIVIRDVPQMESSREFLDLHPWVPPLVQKVTLSFHPPGHYSMPNIPLFEVVPVYLLSRLPNLRVWGMVQKSWGLYSTWLTLHLSALSCYRGLYSSRIHNLELSHVRFRDILDFIRFISAFTSIHRLTCAHNNFLNASSYRLETKMLTQSPKLTSLCLGEGVHILAIEYLLGLSVATLNRLAVTLDPLAFHPFEQADPYYYDRLEKSISRLSQLSSLTLVILCGSPSGSPDRATPLSPDINNSVKILKPINRAHLVDVQVEFKLQTIADLGSYLSLDGASLEACKALDEVLLTFPLCRVICQDPLAGLRAGRAEFWYPSIKRAFPGMNDRGLVAFPHSNATAGLAPGHEKAVSGLVSRNNKWIVTASEDGTIIIWDAERGSIVQEWSAHPTIVYDLALSPDSQRLLSVGAEGDGALAVWDIGNGVHRAAAPEGHTKAVTACAWSPDGALIASASDDRTVRVWDALTFEQRDLFDDPEAEESNYASFDFSPDAHYLAWISSSRNTDPCCTVWRPLAKERPKPPLLSHSGRGDAHAYAFSFDPDSRRIATAHGIEQNAIQIWDLTTGVLLAVLAGHTESVNIVSFSPDGRSLLSTSWDGSARIWDAESGEQTASLEEHDKPSSWSACFSPDGKYIATGSSKPSVRLWRTADASCVAEFTEHTDDVLHVAFSPNGEFLASGDRDGVVHIRRLSSFITN